MITRIIFLIILSIIIDFINVFGFTKMLKNIRETRFYKLFFRFYWLTGILMLAYFTFHFISIGNPGTDYIKYRSFFTVFGVYMLIYIPKLVFSIFVILQFIFNQILKLFKNKLQSKFIIQKIGIVFAIYSCGLVLYGIIWGKTNFAVEKQTIYFSDLPKSFDGYKIAQISDMHLGSFTNPEDVKRGLQMLNSQNPDAIMFTGDMVNNVSEELNAYIHDFDNIKTSDGMFSILGNHDMGDYVKWKLDTLKYKEIESLIEKEKSMGFKMLLNENTILHRGQDSIALIGVENWGKYPFKKYGDLKKALNGVENITFKILLSHDPSHFDAEVKGKTNIQLTLSGHTHGMQFGIDSWGIKWSPAQWIYHNWKGLYKYGNQYLYVNTGFGFVGMPLRIGINPEITILTLRRK